MTLDNWFDHLRSLHQHRDTYSLDRIDSVATRLSLKYFDCPVIVITGTNGKGSTAKTLESIYTQAGYRTGLYTSPHLLQFHERIRIANRDVLDAELLRAFEAIENSRNGVILSVFEFTTLAALWLFQRASLDIMILEAGLGGRLDAVNIVEHDITAVTSIALDHTTILGDTRDAIAFEKTSIARENKIIVVGDENPPQKLFDVIHEKKAKHCQIHRDFSYELKNDVMIYRGKKTISFPVPRLKPQNIATALSIVENLNERLPVSEKNCAQGIAKTSWPGRFEKVDFPFPMILDVAHNPEAGAWLAAQYQRLPTVSQTIAVVGMLQDKDMIATVSPLLPLVDVWLVCGLISENAERGSNGAVIAGFLREQGKMYRLFSTVHDAMNVLYTEHCQNHCNRALIFGSFHTVAAGKRWIQSRMSCKQE